MSRVIAYKTKAGKFNYVVVGDDVNENILADVRQGFERRAGLEQNMNAVDKAIFQALCAGGPEYMTHAQYQKWRRERRNQQARNRRARGKK